MMGRYLPAAVFLGAGAFVLWHNSTYSDSVLLLPFVDSLWPAAKGDLAMQGRITGYGFLVLGFLFGFRAVYATMTSPRLPPR